jgi:hypothetical protein
MTITSTKEVVATNTRSQSKILSIFLAFLPDTE